MDLEEVPLLLNNPGVNNILKAYEILKEHGITPYHIPERLKEKLVSFNPPRNVLVILGPFGWGKSSLLAAIYDLKADKHGAFIGNASDLLKHSDPLGFKEAYLDEIEREIVQADQRGELESMLYRIGDLVRDYHERDKRIALVIKERDVREDIRASVGDVPKDTNVISTDVRDYASEIGRFVINRDLEVLRMLNVLSYNDADVLKREALSFASKLRPRAMDVLLLAKSGELARSLSEVAHALKDALLYRMPKRRSSLVKSLSRKGRLEIIDGRKLYRRLDEAELDGNVLELHIGVEDYEGEGLYRTSLRVIVSDHVPSRSDDAFYVLLFRSFKGVYLSSEYDILPLRLTKLAVNNSLHRDRFSTIGLLDRIYDALKKEIAKALSGAPRARRSSKFDKEVVEIIVRYAMAIGKEIPRARTRKHQRLARRKARSTLAKELRLDITGDMLKEIVRGNLRIINDKLLVHGLSIKVNDVYMTVRKIF